MKFGWNVPLIIMHYVVGISCPIPYEDMANMLNERDNERTTSQLITRLGYPVEDHTVKTSDGYLLGVQRIPVNSTTIRKGVVLLVHGLLCSSSSYVTNDYANQNLATILSDEGYDVWLGNLRGNKYSRRHVLLDPNEKEFWKFTWDQMGQYDLPAMIDYIISKTGVSSISYVGHSMGTTSMFVCLSRNPSYNQKVKVLIALAPVTKTTHGSATINKFYRTAYLLTPLSAAVGTEGECLSYYKIALKLKGRVCEATNVAGVCPMVYDFALSVNSNHINQSRMPFIVSQNPCGTSTYTVIHYSQGIQSDKFQMYDLGTSGNLMKYKQPTPPQYDLGKVKAPVVLISSLEDNQADQKDIDYIRKSLPKTSLIEDFIVEPEDYTHFDFLFAHDANKYVYPKVLENLAKF